MINNREINTLFNNPEDSYIIHFAYLEVDNAIGSTKKIISIHAKNLNSTDSREFSIDKFVTKNDIPIEDIDDWFDDVELSILDEFNSFLKEKSNCNFIYFGEEEGQGLILDELKRIFEARNRAETEKTFKEIPISKRKSVTYLFQFDSQDKSLKTFIKKYNDNKLPPVFLSNGEEGDCFERKLYNKVRGSVLCKIDFIIQILNSNRAISNNGIINSDPVDLETLKPSAIIKNMNVKSWIWLFGIVAVIFSVGMGVNQFLNNNKTTKFSEENEVLKETILNDKKNFLKRESLVIDSLEIDYQNNLNLLEKKYKHKIDSIKLKNKMVKP